MTLVCCGNAERQEVGGFSGRGVCPGRWQVASVASARIAERCRASIWVHIVTAVRPEHFKLGDEPLLSRYCEVVVMCDLIGKLLAADVAEGRPSPHLSTSERLLKMLVVFVPSASPVCPLAGTPHKDGRPPRVLDPHGNGHAPSVYETMRLANDAQ